MNPQSSTYLSVVDNQWSTFTMHSFNHGIDEARTCRLAKQLPGISQLKKKYPQIDVERKQNKIKPLKNGIYIGGLNEEGKPQGYGMIKYTDRSILEAQFKDGKANGKGFKWFGEDWYYVGDFLENQFDGRGVFVSPDLSYEGQLKNNAFHGQGQLSLTKNNGKFIGIMENGQMKEGRFTWEITSRLNQRLRFEYNGTFSNNQFHGDNCTLESSLGIYKGSFRDGKKDGQGRFQFLEKYQYIGQYRNNIKHGSGTLYNPQIKMVGGTEVSELSEEEKNISYKGNFENNLPHGKGYVYKESQKKLVAAQYVEGIWSEAIKNVVD